MPQLYKICEDEFNGYIDELVNAGLIRRRISDGITYYDATLAVDGMKANAIKKCVEDALRIVSVGVQML